MKRLLLVAVSILQNLYDRVNIDRFIIVRFMGNIYLQIIGYG